MIQQSRTKNIRFKSYDYKNGWFFVTNKTDFAKDFFTGAIKDIIKAELIQLVSKTDGIGLDYFHTMPNHIHVILIFEDAAIPLSEFWRRYKAITTIQAKKSGFKGATLWQRNYFEHVIRNEKALANIRGYIQNNPLKADLPLEEIYGESIRPVR